MNNKLLFIAVLGSLGVFIIHNQTARLIMIIPMGFITGIAIGLKK